MIYEVCCHDLWDLEIETNPSEFVEEEEPDIDSQFATNEYALDDLDAVQSDNDASSVGLKEFVAV